MRALRAFGTLLAVRALGAIGDLVALALLAPGAFRAVRAPGAIGGRRLGTDRLLAALVEGAALEVEALRELTADVLHHATHVELVTALAALLAQLLQQMAQTLHASALRVAHAALHQ